MAHLTYLEDSNGTWKKSSWGSHETDPLRALARKNLPSATTPVSVLYSSPTLPAPRPLWNLEDTLLRCRVPRVQSEAAEMYAHHAVPRGWYWVAPGSLGPFQQMLQAGCCNTSQCQTTQRHRCSSSLLSTLGIFRNLASFFFVNTSYKAAMDISSLPTSRPRRTAAMGSMEVRTANSTFKPAFPTQNTATARPWRTSVLSNRARWGPLQKALPNQC